MKTFLAATIQRGSAAQAEAAKSAGAGRSMTRERSVDLDSLDLAIALNDCERLDLSRHPDIYRMNL